MAIHLSRDTSLVVPQGGETTGCPGLSRWSRLGQSQPFVPDYGRDWPLHISLRNGHLDVARYLLDHGADPHLSEGYSDETPLSIAQANKDAEAIALLKAFGLEIQGGFWHQVKQTLWQRLMKILVY